MQLRQMLFVSGITPHDDELIGNATSLASALNARLSALAIVRKEAKDDEAAFYRTRLQQRAVGTQSAAALPVMIEKEPRHADAVQRAVAEGGFDSVVLAMPARRALGAAIATQGFAPVLRAATVPVVALPHNQPPDTIQRILLLVEFSERGQRVLSSTVELCQRLGAALDLVYVFDGENPPAPTPERAAATSPRALIQLDQQQMTEMRDQAAASGIDVRSNLLEGATVDALAGYANEHKPDLVVLANRGARRVADIFSGTLVDRVLKRLQCPVVLVRG